MQVSKWGNSLAIRLPKALVDELGVNEGDELAVVAARAKKLTVSKVNRRDMFMAAMEQFNWPNTDNYKFNRDDANER